MPVSSRGSHAVPKGGYENDDFQRLLEKPSNRTPKSDFQRLLEKPYRPRDPSSPRVPSVRRNPKLPLGPLLRGIGGVPTGPLGLAPYVPTPWQHGPRPIGPAGIIFYPPCMRMQTNIEFYRDIGAGLAISGQSCLNGQGVGGAPNGNPNEHYGADASWNITIPSMGSGFHKGALYGVYQVSSTTWRGQHRISWYKPDNGIAILTPTQAYPMRMPNLSPMADPNNWPLSPSNGGPEAGKPVFPEPAPQSDPLGFGGGGSLVVETGTGPIGVAILTPGQQVKPGYLGPVAPPGKGVKEAGKRRTSARLGRLLFKALDDISESCEVVDALYDALPNDVKKAAMKKAGYVWSPSAGKYVLPGDGSLKASDKTTEGFRPAGAGSRSFVDQFGQYGLDGCDWKAQALYDHADKLDVCGGVQNILKNYLEDKIHGVTHRFRPKNTVNGLADADKEFGLQLNNLLDEVLDLCPK